MDNSPMRQKTNKLLVIIIIGIVLMLAGLIAVGLIFKNSYDERIASLQEKFSVLVVRHQK